MKKYILFLTVGIFAWFSLGAPALLAAPEKVGTDSASYNWSGYVANGGSYTSVTGSWVVPRVSSQNIGSADATWVGIGGVSSDDLIQAGTQAIDDERGAVAYQAWYELLPDISIPVPLPISPGDSVTATLTEQSRDQWLIIIRDNTTGASYQKTVSYKSSNSSAEWVEERVSDLSGVLYPLNNFGALKFTNAAAVRNGQLTPLSKLNPQPLTMVNGVGQVIARASELTGDGFRVTRQMPGPSTVVSGATSGLLTQSANPGSVIVITFGPGGMTVSDGTGQSLGGQYATPVPAGHWYRWSHPFGWIGLLGF